MDKDKITVKTLLKKDYSLFNKSCSRIGIASYTHGTILAGFGKEVIFIFFSCEPFDEKYRKNINLLKPSQHFLKVEFDKDLYSFLLSILPAKQALLLKQDYKQFLEK